MKATTIAAQFERYRADVIPAAAPAVQVEECRRAFYAGSYAMLINLAESIGDDSTDEEEGVAMLEALKVECETFAANLEPTPAAGAPSPLVDASSGYNVRSTEVESALRDLAALVQPRVPRGFGFTLLLFSYGRTGLANEGPQGAMFYISTADRDDMVQALREFINKQVS